jgi:hypothetical protein
MQTCRFCKKTNYESDEALIKYGVRHYAHWTCGFAHFGIKGFTDKLSAWQFNSIPYRFVETSPELQQILKNRQDEDNS